MKDDTVKAISAVFLGILLIAIGCLPMVGYKDLHGFLVGAGCFMVFFGGWELI